MTDDRICLPGIALEEMVHAGDQASNALSRSNAAEICPSCSIRNPTQGERCVLLIISWKSRALYWYDPSYTKILVTVTRVLHYHILVSHVSMI
jgi:hypothetical protein